MKKTIKNFKNLKRKLKLLRLDKKSKRESKSYHYEILGSGLAEKVYD